VRRAFRKKHSNESEFYFGGKDRRRFHGFVTIGREPDGADYEAWLFEQLLNDPEAESESSTAFSRNIQISWLRQ